VFAAINTVTSNKPLLTMEQASSNAKKRSYEAADEDDNPSEQEVAAMSRSERKRHREKKRRSDVNKGFDELMALLLEIDPEVRADAEERASKGQCKRSLGAHEDNVLSRVDLIATAIKVLKRVNWENEKHKKMLEDLVLKNGGSQASEAAGMARPGASLGGQTAPGGRADMSHFGATASLADRAALLQKSALGLGSTAAASGPSNSHQQAWEAAQLRAKANLLSGAGVGPSLRDYSTADIFALRAAAANRAASAASLPPHPSALDTSALLAARRQLLQTMMQQQHQQNSQMMHDSIFGSALQGDSVPSHLMGAEGLYSALGGGAMQSKKEEELRRLRAAGHQL
jgi:Helix-loop-helix DNA-binding domain